MFSFHVITKPGCPHCDRAKTAIRDAGYSFTSTVYSTGEEIQAFKNKGFRTFPQIWLGSQHIGGADDLEVWLDQIADNF